MSASPPPISDLPVLQLQAVHCAVGAGHAIRGVSLQVRRGEIVALLGRPGAGKTTLLKTISGIFQPTQGTIVFKGEDITGHDPAYIVEQGLSHVPQGRELFARLSVQDNLAMGAYIRSDRDAVVHDMEVVCGIFAPLRAHFAHSAGALPAGQQQMLAIGRAFMARPDLMLLDEPSLGLTPEQSLEILAAVVRINREYGIAILLSEQNAALALDTADFGYVLENGVIAMQDTCAHLRALDAIQNLQQPNFGTPAAPVLPA